MARSNREPAVIGSAASDAFYIGRYWDEKSGFDHPRIGPKMQMPGAEPGIVIGAPRMGKDSGIGIYNGLRLEGKSWVVIGDRGEAAAVCGPWRRTLGPVYMVNQFGQCADIPGYEDLASDGWCMLGAHDPKSPRFFDYAAGDAEALLKLEKGNGEHFSRRAREFGLGHMLNEVTTAKAEGRAPLLANVRAAITEAPERDAKGKLIKGVSVTAARLVKTGGPQVASLLGTFADADNEEVQSVLATASGQTQWLLSEPIREDEKRPNGVPLNELGERPMSVFGIMPHEMMETHSVPQRLLLAQSLRALYRPTPIVCSYWINELASLGRLTPIENALGLVAGYGIQLILVVQSLTQLTDIYGDGWEKFLGMAAFTILIGGAADKFTAEYLASRSGERTILSPNAGLSLNPGGVGLSSGEAFTRRQHLTPHDLYGLRKWFGYVWVSGLSNAIPAYFPPYWDVELLAQRARANPFYRG